MKIIIILVSRLACPVIGFWLGQLEMIMALIQAQLIFLTKMNLVLILFFVMVLMLFQQIWFSVMDLKTVIVKEVWDRIDQVLTHFMGYRL